VPFLEPLLAFGHLTQGVGRLIIRRLASPHSPERRWKPSADKIFDTARPRLAILEISMEQFALYRRFIANVCG